MKSLAFFFCWAILAMSFARAEVTPSATGSQGTTTAPNWSAAIQKFSKEGPEAAPDTIDSRLLIDHLSDNDPVAKAAAAAPAGAASAPKAASPTAAGKPGETNRVPAAPTQSALDKSSGEDDWATTVRHSVRDIVKPFQEFLPGSSDATEKPAEQGATSGQAPGQYAAGRPATQRRSEEQRRRENIQASYLLGQFIDELLPWAAGALGLLAFGYGVTLWLGHVKRKPSVPVAKSTSARSGSRSSSGKKRRRSSI